MKILIAPYSQKMRNGQPSAKRYPFWQEVLAMMPSLDIVQIGVQGEDPLVADCRFNKPLKEIKRLIGICDTWISVDSFLPHLAQHCGRKPGVVLWTVSDPLIFGYPNNVNLLKDRAFLRKNQFDVWEAAAPTDPANCVSPEEVVAAVRNILLGFPDVT